MATVSACLCFPSGLKSDILGLPFLFTNIPTDNCVLSESGCTCWCELLFEEVGFVKDCRLTTEY